MAIVNVRHPVRQIPQPRGSTKCWAACIAMVLHRRGASSDAIVDAVVRAAQARNVGLYPNLSLRENAVDALAGAFGLFPWHRENPATVLPPVFETALQRSAAVVLGERLQQDAGEHQHHAVVVDGLRGDTGGPLHINVHGIDPLVPAGGGAFDRTVAGFQNFMRIEHLLYRT